MVLCCCWLWLVICCCGRRFAAACNVGCMLLVLLFVVGWLWFHMFVVVCCVVWRWPLFVVCHSLCEFGCLLCVDRCVLFVVWFVVWFVVSFVVYCCRMMFGVLFGDWCCALIVACSVMVLAFWLFVVVCAWCSLFVNCC